METTLIPTPTSRPTVTNRSAQHDLTVYVSVADSDADTSSNGIDSIEASTVEMEIIRGSQEM